MLARAPWTYVCIVNTLVNLEPRWGMCFSLSEKCKWNDIVYYPFIHPTEIVLHLFHYESPDLHFSSFPPLLAICWSWIPLCPHSKYHFTVQLFWSYCRMKLSQKMICMLDFVSPHRSVVGDGFELHPAGERPGPASGSSPRPGSAPVTAPETDPRSACPWRPAHPLSPTWRGGERRFTDRNNHLTLVSKKFV